MTSERILRSIDIHDDMTDQEWDAVLEQIGITDEKRAWFVRVVIEAAERAQAEADGAV